MAKPKTRNIDSFEDIIGEDEKNILWFRLSAKPGNDVNIIIRGDFFVEDFFNQSESSVIAKVRGNQSTAFYWNENVQQTKSRHKKKQ